MDGVNYDELVQLFAVSDLSSLEGCAVAFILFAVGILIGIIAFHILSRRWIS